MSTDCPICGSNGRLATLTIPDLYRCTNWKCKTEYSVQRNRCKRCNDPIEDDFDFCPFHWYLGNDPRRPGREEYCKICREPADEGSEYCTTCTEEYA